MKTYQSSIKRFRIVSEPSDIKKVKIASSNDAAKYIMQFYSNDIDVIESFFILCLNQVNNTVGYAKISQGGITGTIVDPMIVAKYAIDNLSKSVIIAHNHPSGNTSPSEADRRITAKIQSALRLLDCTLLDHLILTEDENNFFSFADHGLI